jgi:hypothetical protein
MKVKHISDTINIPVNYTVTRTPLEFLGRIYLELMGKPHKGLEWIDLLDETGFRLRSDILKVVLSSLRKYVGYYSPMIEQSHFHNLVPVQIRESLATLFSGTDITPTLKVNMVSLGLDATAFVPEDTQLGNEFIRATFDNRYSSGTSAFLDKFFGTNDVAGQTFGEVALWIDGTPTPDSGFAASLASMNETVDLTQTLTINAEIGFASLN